MPPAVTAITPANEGEATPTCKACVGPLSDLALKCCHCNGHVHLRCSGLPDYILVRLTVTQSTYSCFMCVKSKDLKADDDKYNTELTKLNEVIAKEVSIIDRTNAEADNTITSANGEDNTQVSQATDLG